MKKIIEYLHERNIDGWIFFLFCIYLVLLIKAITVESIDNNIFFGFYSIAVSFYILTRFLVSSFYHPDQEVLDNNKYMPTITFGIPSKNEAENIYETLIKIINSDYPKDKFNVIAVNDGSTDKTLTEMKKAKKIAKLKGIELQIVDWKLNRGKREGMAECIRRSKNEIIVFIDSDSFVTPHTARELVKYFVNDRVAAVTGHAYVANADKNILTKMQAVRYYVAFKAYKGSEALFGSVTCCSGCCSAYRRKCLQEILDKWLSQSFLGVKCTYGDDRSLTNYLLQKNYHTLYSPTAIAYTVVPDTFRKFINQQLRWKKSWVRESLKASVFMWKRNPINSIAFYTGLILPLLAPIVVFRAIFWYPVATHRFPIFYLLGLILMAVVYGLYYYIYTKDKDWVFGVLFASFNSLVLIWQLPWAIINIRDSRWGTR